MSPVGDQGKADARAAAALLGPHARFSVGLEHNNGYRLGGPAAVQFTCSTRDDVESLASAIHATGAPVFVLGHATNLLIADRGINAVVVRLAGSLAEVDFVGGCRVVVGGGASMPAVAEACNAQGMAGIEWAVSVPGTLGGAVAMNAGVGLGREVRDVVVSADVIDLRTGALETWRPERLGFEHRGSSVTSDHLVVSATLALTEDDPSACAARSTDAKAYRASTQPTKQTTGSVFSTPGAWRHVDEAGFRGYRVRSARISELHTNFIVVEKRWALRRWSADVLELMSRVRRGVHERTGTRLDVETRLVGFTSGELERLELPVDA